MQSFADNYSCFTRVAVNMAATFYVCMYTKAVSIKPLAFDCHSDNDKIGKEWNNVPGCFGFQEVKPR